MKKAPPETRISVRIPQDSDLKVRITAAARTVGLPESLLVVHAVEAVVNYIEEQGRITLPIAVREQSG